jgi:hypothetical protein
MKTESSWNVRSIVGKLMLGLVLTTMIGAIGVQSAQSKDNDRRNERHDNSRSEYRGRGYDHNSHNRDQRYYRDKRYYRAPVYRERVYVEPRVIYAPPRPPGVSIFLPPLFF